MLTVVAGLYVKQAMAYLSVRSQSRQQEAIVRTLERQNAALGAQERSLKNPETVQREARALGMVRMGEHPYVITGLPNR